MRMKDDHLKNGQLKPAYNWQVSTSGQYVVNYSIHQSSSDIISMIPHLETYHRLYDQYPHTITADAGYGCEENYVYLEDQYIEAFVKYGAFHAEQKKAYQEDAYKTANLHYNPHLDCFYCPIGQKMTRIAQTTTKTTTGFKQTIIKYQAQNCEDCPLRWCCHTSKENRIIRINFNLLRLKALARDKLHSQQGIAHRKQRSVDVEAAFGNIKNNKKFTRHALRGLAKTEIELGLLAISHNLAKFARIIKELKQFIAFLSLGSPSVT